MFTNKKKKLRLLAARISTETITKPTQTADLVTTTATGRILSRMRMETNFTRMRMAMAGCKKRARVVMSSTIRGQLPRRVVTSMWSTPLMMKMMTAVIVLKATPTPVVPVMNRMKTTRTNLRPHPGVMTMTNKVRRLRTIMKNMALLPRMIMKMNNQMKATMIMILVLRKTVMMKAHGMKMKMNMIALMEIIVMIMTTIVMVMAQTSIRIK
mmetsp:Transcript_27798/g.70218  ORF Transcript_27798/g.70218 Transcript_27798/m.70218 type:complete len:211 (+) Transcript_27798:1309-1941(+)